MNVIKNCTKNIYKKYRYKVVFEIGNTAAILILMEPAMQKLKIFSQNI